MNNFPAMTEEQRQELIRHNRAKVNAITPQFLKESTPGVKKHLQREIDSAKIVIAALTAKPVGAIRIEMDWNTHRNVATLDMREDLVAADMATGDKLFTAPPAPALRVPDGWKLVPIEPTEDMVIRGFESKPAQFWCTPEEWAEYEAMSGCQQAAHKARLCYAAMLAAAPEA